MTRRFPAGIFAVVGASLALALAACGSSGHPATAPNYNPTRTVAPADTPVSPGNGPPESGCNHVLSVIGQVRGEYKSAPSRANEQLRALAKSAPPALSVQIDLAGVDEGNYQIEIDMGHSGKAWAKQFMAQLREISQKCGQS